MACCQAPIAHSFLDSGTVIWVTGSLPAWNKRGENGEITYSTGIHISTLSCTTHVLHYHIQVQVPIVLIHDRKRISTVHIRDRKVSHSNCRLDQLVRPSEDPIKRQRFCFCRVKWLRYMNTSYKYNPTDGLIRLQWPPLRPATGFKLVHG